MKYIALAFCLFAAVSAQAFIERGSLELSQIFVKAQCDIFGKCKGSPVLSLSITNDQTECLNHCKFGPYQSYCKWITFDQDTGLCELFEDCNLSDTGDCETCISSEVYCEKSTDPVCYVSGLCEGFAIKITKPSVYECLDICKSYSDESLCGWISYSQETQLCLLLDRCSLDPSNEEFVTAQVTCDSNSG